MPADVQTYQVNVTEEAAVETAFAAIDEHFNGLDVLINNAGILRDGMLIKCKDGEITHKMPLQQWQSVIDVNLTGTFLCGREASAVMAKREKEGRDYQYFFGCSGREHWSNQLCSN